MVFYSFPNFVCLMSCLKTPPLKNVCAHVSVQMCATCVWVPAECIRGCRITQCCPIAQTWSCGLQILFMETWLWSWFVHGSVVCAFCFSFGIIKIIGNWENMVVLCWQSADQRYYMVHIKSLVQHRPDSPGGDSKKLYYWDYWLRVFSICFLKKLSLQLVLSTFQRI